MCDAVASDHVSKGMLDEVDGCKVQDRRAWKVNFGSRGIGN